MVPVVEILMHAYMAKPAPPAPLWPGRHASSELSSDTPVEHVATQQPRPPSSPHPKAEQKSKTISDESTTQHHESNLCFHSFLPPADADADAPTPLPVHPP
ncbi:hypothetical protein BHM03_00033166 [Ensete ventricosum]|uniref:Uncharacterized protein n=1 Tax=Ensete ventricosum TaxID=4639 RepID=A0A445MIV0_ENSVE|nr:hypothetical protein BHM03_00033166 [Ensete ventricosum]